MNASKETNINVQLNPVNEKTKFRISYERPEGASHKKYIAQFRNYKSDEWQTMRQFKGDTEEVIPAHFGCIKKAKRFMRKILIANNIEIPEDFKLLDDMWDQHYIIFRNGIDKEEIIGNEHFNNRWNNLIECYKNLGYKSLEQGEGFNILVNYPKMQSVFLVYRRDTGFIDTDGKHIFENDMLGDKDGNTVHIYQHDDESYYMRIVSGFGEYKDYDIKSSDDLVAKGVHIVKSNYEMFG